MYLVGSTHSVAGSVFPSPNEEKEQTPAAELPQGLCGCVSVSATALIRQVFSLLTGKCWKKFKLSLPPPIRVDV